MSRCVWILTLLPSILLVDCSIAGEPPAGSSDQLPGWDSKPLLTTLQETNGNGKEGEGNGNGDQEEEGPKHIRDNAFLIEEASNQEPGVVQHIFNWINFWDHTSLGSTRDFTSSYLMEIPLGSQTHQFSFFVPFETTFEKPHDGSVLLQGDIGDMMLNYRYQLLGQDEERLWCSPRFSVILPTGDERFGTGNGELGYQVNLPISWYGDRFDFHFNAGATYVPDVSVPLAAGLVSPGQDLHGYNLAGAVYWKPEVYLHFFVEMVALWIDEIDEVGFRDRQTQVLANPGFRYAICQLDEVEWVIGLSAPIGLTPDTPDIGLFAYMSVEHNFRKLKKNGNSEKKCNGD